MKPTKVNLRPKTQQIRSIENNSTPAIKASLRQMNLFYYIISTKELNNRFFKVMLEISSTSLVE